MPTRLFHWLLVVCVVAAFVTAKIGGSLMVWHGRLGLAILGLLVFRIVWGFNGSTHARFANFVRGPAAILAYLEGKWHGVGHNPLGAVSVLAMLGTLTVQATTGLFANDDIAFAGHLYPLVGNALSSQITGIHRLMEKILLPLSTLHVGAIIFYARVKKQNLVKPMITGWVDHGLPEPSAKGGSTSALVVAVLIAVCAVWMASGTWLPAPPPPPAGQSAPDF
ncbi:MAG: cytochrome b/b6 domain-containing protein [Rhodocyclaceae bacterium]